MARRIIDMHQHLSKLSDLDALTAVYERVGVVKAVLLGLPERRTPGSRQTVLDAAQKRPDLVIPFMGLDLDDEGADDVARAQDDGFKGLKFIAPRRAYNDPAYFPVYEKAAERKMPVLFHLGIVANNDAWRTADSNLMRPIHLDHIARSVPGLTVIGAHFGNPWSDEAAMACRWNANLFFDFSGSLLKYRKPDYLNGLLWWKRDGPYKSPDNTSAWQKIVFGSDVGPKMIEDVIHDYETLMDALAFDAALRDEIWYGTAAKILGLGK